MSGLRAISIVVMKGQLTGLEKPHLLSFHRLHGFIEFTEAWALIREENLPAKFHGRLRRKSVQVGQKHGLGRKECFAFEVALLLEGCRNRADETV